MGKRVTFLLFKNTQLDFIFFFYNGMLWNYFMFSRLFNNMENNIILSETVLSQTVLNASPSDIMLC